jgi:chemotaxis protein methyltransferase CheR
VHTDSLSETLCQRLSALIAEYTGLHFPPERYIDMQRGIAAAAEEFGFDQAPRCADWLLSTPLNAQQLRALASHLTIGETYFFRERKTFDALARHILPELLRRRRGRNQRLRLWSAACCTGEEPYSLAILLHQMLGDASDWDITIVATDINERYLQRAAAGLYGEWSFRDAPPGIKERYFTRAADGRFAILPAIRQRVRFMQRNLALEASRVPDPNLQAMDLILCRNVLMYFTADHARRLADGLYGALADGGWLVVAPCECSQSLFARFATVNFPGIVLYRKQRAEAALPCPAPAPPAVMLDPAPFERSPAPCLEDSTPTADSPDCAYAAPEELAAGARALANRGQIEEALTLSERWIAADKVNATAHYLHATVLQELGQREDARRSLRRVIYLQPRFALAHFALGNLARADERPAEANRHFENALSVLAGLPAHEPLPESDGMTAEQLASIIGTLIDTHAGGVNE